jgi:hypothetical protein
MSARMKRFMEGEGTTGERERIIDGKEVTAATEEQKTE